MDVFVDLGSGRVGENDSQRKPSTISYSIQQEAGFRCLLFYPMDAATTDYFPSIENKSLFELV